MPAFMAQLRVIGWAAIEAAFLLVVLCVLLNIIIGGDSDSFIAHVASNASAFLQSLPPGVVLGIALLIMIYGLVKARLQR